MYRDVLSSNHERTNNARCDVIAQTCLRSRVVGVGLRTPPAKVTSVMPAVAAWKFIQIIQTNRSSLICIWHASLVDGANNFFRDEHSERCVTDVSDVTSEVQRLLHSGSGYHDCVVVPVELRRDTEAASRQDVAPDLSKFRSESF